MTTDEKYETIHKAYYNPNGFGNNAVLLKDAQELDPTITMKDVVAWRSQNRERTKKMRGYNSYIAPEAKYEYQVDLFYYTNPNAKEILLYTPLLKWYIQKGLKITKFYNAIEYVGKESFKNFAFKEKILNIKIMTLM